jgi:hypothetical protein
MVKIVDTFYVDFLEYLYVYNYKHCYFLPILACKNG